MSTSADAHEQEFSRTRGHFSDLTSALERLTKQLLEAEAIQVAQLEARTKTTRNFGEKIERKKFKYKDPLKEITDLSALRVILYYVDDVARVGQIIEREFDVDWENSLRHEPDRDPEHFGYRSDHYVVRVSKERCKLPEWKRFEANRAEIQVRTVMQHAWAAVDHQIRYKQADLPRDLQRRLSRLSAILEGADEQFMGIKEKAEELSVQYADSVERGDLRRVGLDALSLRAYLDRVEGAWLERAARAGFNPVGVSPEFIESGREDRTQELLEVLQASGVSTLKQYEERLTRAETWGETALGVIDSEIRRARGRPIGIVLEYILLMLLQVETGNHEHVEQSHWHPDVAGAIITAIESVRQDK